MRFVVLLIVSSVFAVEMAKKPNHGKIVSCPIFTQSVLSYLETKFKNEKMDWSLCTRLTVFDNEVLNLEGKKKFKNERNKVSV